MTQTPPYEAQLKEYIRDVADFPKPGIDFKDITPLLKSPEALKLIVKTMVDICREDMPDYIAGIESRGFILGMPLAYELNVGFIPVRKAGKLPAATYRQEYTLEYGTDVLEIHQDAIEPGKKVWVIDDLLATGGTAAATLKLLAQSNANVLGMLFAIELNFLNGREKLTPCKTISLMKY